MEPLKQSREEMASSFSPTTLSSKQEKQGLGWMEWLGGWSHLIYEVLFQKITSIHLQTPLPLPPLNVVTFIVTGSTSGIGLEIAKQLAESGAHVVMAVRNPSAAHNLIQKWETNRSNTSLLNVVVMELNLLSLESVVKFAEAWNSLSKPLHVLINNPGIYSIGEAQRFSNDGYETHVQVNHFGPSLLSILLLPSLKRGAPSRIINVNSVMHFIGFVDTNDMNFVSGRRKFTSLEGYSSSKLAQLMFSSALQKHLPSEAGISVVCVEPGSVHTNVARDLPKIVQIAYHLIPFFLFNALEGSRSAVFAATDVEIPKYCAKLKAEEWPVCAFISYNCRPMSPSKEAHNVSTSQMVWEKTLDMVGLPSDAVEKLLQGKEIQCQNGTSLN
ncbi:dehydrogenase/reductase SDR family member FEY-like [Cornus florida]|uniref:dehydrogenase/reductase SDR family member FEY-like n=1 Tax=Cornus florida TaxID=4283 RepID=UPI00289A7DFC|nr:dehydrogenase/reductase SDR family member FEY-like [Cornus florida]